MYRCQDKIYITIAYGTCPSPHLYRNGGPMIVPEDQITPFPLTFIIKNTLLILKKVDEVIRRYLRVINVFISHFNIYICSRH